MKNKWFWRAVASVVPLLLVTLFWLWTVVERVLWISHDFNPEGLPILGLILPVVEAAVDGVFGFFGRIFVHEWYGLYIIAAMVGSLPYVYYRTFRRHVTELWAKPSFWSYKFPPPNRMFLISATLTFGSLLIFAPFFLFPVGHGLLAFELLDQAKGNMQGSTIGQIFFAFQIVHEAMFWSGAVAMLLLLPISCVLWARLKLQAYRAAREEPCF